MSGGECVRPPIGQALAEDALEGLFGALPIGRRAVIVAEVELGGVARKVRLADMVINADDAALEDRKEVLDRVRVLLAARIFRHTVVDLLVPPIMLAGRAVA